MIRYLAIKNLAVIESASIEFEHSFNVLTGETGAGKSMLVGAVGLLLGGRASPDLVRTGEDLATIEAQFNTPDGRDLVVRREITSQGRSRAFIDGQLASAAALRSLVGELVELHGQHEHQALLDSSAHLPLLDEWAGLTGERNEVEVAWAALGDAERAVARAELDEGERLNRLELVAFHLAELGKAQLAPGEDEELERTREVLRHAGRLQTLCAEAYGLLYEHESPALGTLGQVWKRVSELSSIDETFAVHLAARDGIKAQLEDLALTLRDYQDRLEASPGRLQQVEDRLAHIERLKRKHGPTLSAVLAVASSLRQEHEALTGSPEQKDAARAALDVARARFLEWARRLSASRQAAARRLGPALESALADLGMANARFELRLACADGSRQSWTSGGVDTGEFFLAANLGEDARPLARIASGGELSRVMLAFKTLGAGERPGRTLVFDEVDAGIGGRTAAVVGEKLRSLGDRSQVLCITHLPQIAALASTHFAIDKHIKGPRTVTSVTKLDEAAREHEVARMMGGEAAVSEDLLNGARALIQQGKAKVAAGAKAKGESQSRAKAKVHR